MSRRRRGLRTLLGLWLVLLPVGALASTLNEERDLGRQFDLRALARFPLLRDPEIVEYLDAIGQRLVGALEERPFTFHFRALGDVRWNAFAIPGGYVYVHSGILSRARSDDEIAGVLGHEIAHIQGHHFVRQQAETKALKYGALLGTLLAAIQPAAAAGAGALHGAVELRYRRELEQEADLVGLRVMRAAGYDPHGMLALLSTLLDEQRLAPNLPPPYLLSHPLTEQRLATLDAMVRREDPRKDGKAAPSLGLERTQLLVRLRTQPAPEVVSQYRQRAEISSADARSQYLLGRAYLETNALMEGRRALEQARDLGLPEAERELGRLAFLEGDYERARSLLNTAISRQPRDGLAYLELGRTEEARGHLPEAMDGYRAALRLLPNLEEGHHQLGILAGRQGDPGAGFYHLGVAFYLRGEHDRAATQLEKALPLLDVASEEKRNAEDLLTQLSEYLGR